MSKYQGFEGQDRENYTDNQDRENYTEDKTMTKKYVIEIEVETTEEVIENLLEDIQTNLEELEVVYHLEDEGLLAVCKEVNDNFGNFSFGCNPDTEFGV